MRTSWKLACGITVAALLVYGASHLGNPQADPITPQVAIAVQNSQSIEPVQQALSNDMQAFATPTPKPAKPVAEDPSCTDGCFEQENGYNWAEQLRVDDPVDCENDSPSFVEGCQVYAEAQQATADDSWEDK